MSVSGLGVFLGKLVYDVFDKTTYNPGETQEKLLLNILEKNKDCEYGKKYNFADIHSVADFQEKIPYSTFDDYLEYVDRMVNKNEENVITSSKIIRYCSSSGSVGTPKIQPKTKRDLWIMQCNGFCAPVYVAAMQLKKNGEKFPAQIGPLAISLNGHPLANNMRCNGAGQIPLTYLKSIMKFFCTTPEDFMYPEDEENTDLNYFHLRFALENRNVSYLGSMVITMLTQMFEYLEENWEMICDDIEHGTLNKKVRCPADVRAKYEKKFKPNPKRAEELRAEFRKGFDTPIVKRIWPKVGWGYGMISSTLSVYENKLRKYVGDLPLHNMGYAASEGYMAVPVELNVHDYALLPRSVFFEFLPLDAPEGTKALTIEQLEVGKNYEIIITNSSGLYRYRIEDVIHVTGMYHKTPRIEFLYRLNMGLNIANEKTTTQMLDWAALQVGEEFGISFRGFSFYPDTDAEMVHYTMLAEPDSDISSVDMKKLTECLDEKLRASNEKYEKYRRWGMIGDPEIVILKKGTYDGYIESLRAQGRIVNQVKPVAVINTDERKEYFFSHRV